MGDLNGVTEQLDHVASLGVDAIWLAPHYVSPWADGGYDVADHRAVEPRLGTLADFDRLVARAHELGLRVIVDQVLNHTSCEHPWFVAALDGDDAMAERYLFLDPKPDGTPPNNWLSFFGTPGWTWSHRRRQYFFHQFLACQPSLDLRHPQVQEAHRDQIRYWRDRGVDGFRFDAVTSYLWDESLADNPPATPEVKARVQGPDFSPYTWQDHVHDMLPGDGADYAQKLRDWAGEDAWLLGEIGTGNKSFEICMSFSAPGRLDAAYSTDLPESHGAPAVVARAVDQTDLQRFAHWMSCHDQPRHNRSGTPEEARFFALLMAVLPGPWILYQGEEWGLPQPELLKEEITDPYDLLYWPNHPGREGPRVPMPWDPDAGNFGFTDGTPWLPMRWQPGPLRQAQQEDGVAATYRRLIALRREMGWAAAAMEKCDHGEDWLELCLLGEQGRFRAWFGYGPEADAPAIDDDALCFALKGNGDAEWRAAVWKLD
ncbi:alpha-amylase family glycosyl hydrolase [Oceaniglobus roseus]|uniref:alpha-amylase family glycosyl hydrolase n=1 Tax=Oceaniglobus roseus TaxID=1737570 RepID=UPI0012FFD77C|nr:alpha-amylase family glycosyl hydrolase [Kandeliimicrobium roseum]